MIVSLFHRQDQTQEQRTLQEQIVYLFRDSNTEFTRFSSVVGLAFWSIVLWWPGDTIAQTEAFRLLTFLNDAWWGAVLMTIAILLTISAIKDWRTVHAVGLLFGMVWWTCLTLAILITAIVRQLPPPPGIAAYSTFAIGAVWAFLRYMARHNVVRRNGE